MLRAIAPYNVHFFLSKEMQKQRVATEEEKVIHPVEPIENCKETVSGWLQYNILSGKMCCCLRTCYVTAKREIPFFMRSQRSNPVELNHMSAIHVPMRHFMHTHRDMHACTAHTKTHLMYIVLYIRVQR